MEKSILLDMEVSFFVFITHTLCWHLAKKKWLKTLLELTNKLFCPQAKLQGIRMISKKKQELYLPEAAYVNEHAFRKKLIRKSELE